MNIKGIAFLSGKNSVISRLGEKCWNDFYKKFKESNPEFPDKILATTKIPIDTFILFQDAMIKEFNNGNKEIWWKYGGIAAKQTLSDKGPFRIFLKRRRTPKEFINNLLHRVWNLYYDAGIAKNELEGNNMHIYLLNMPKYYIYIEYTVMGFLQKSLELVGISVKKTVKIKGSAEEIHYKFVLDL
ncbi:MAG: hypothetical protein ACFFD2_14095 [Promethearchaeota archaeon]